jgi:hypothetical protein
VLLLHTGISQANVKFKAENPKHESPTLKLSRDINTLKIDIHKTNHVLPLAWKLVACLHASDTVEGGDRSLIVLARNLKRDWPIAHPVRVHARAPVRAPVRFCQPRRHPVGLTVWRSAVSPMGPKE